MHFLWRVLAIVSNLFHFSAFCIRRWSGELVFLQTLTALLSFMWTHIYIKMEASRSAPLVRNAWAKTLFKEVWNLSDNLFCLAAESDHHERIFRICLNLLCDAGAFKYSQTSNIFRAGRFVFAKVCRNFGERPGSGSPVGRRLAAPPSVGLRSVGEVVTGWGLVQVRCDDGWGDREQFHSLNPGTCEAARGAGRPVTDKSPKDRRNNETSRCSVTVGRCFAMTEMQCAV